MKRTRKSKRTKETRQSFSDILTSSKSEINSTLWQRACEVNQIAKLCEGKSRTVAYQTKTDCLQQLIDKGQAIVRSDEVDDHMMLSVQLDRRRRLHAPVSSIKKFTAS